MSKDNLILQRNAILAELRTLPFDDPYRDELLEELEKIVKQIEELDDKSKTDWS